MKKFISLLSILLILTMVGCENVSYHTDSSSEEESKDIYQQLESQLPPVAFDKEREFIILTDSEGTFTQDETASQGINVAIAQRNAFIEANYGAKIVVKKADLSTLADELSAAEKAGNSICHMISVPVEEAVKLYGEGLLGDINKLPNFNLENGFFDTNLAKPLATNNSLYLLADPCALVYDSANVIYFNRNLLKTPETDDESSKSEDLSESTEAEESSDDREVDQSVEILAMQGKWTWDAFNEYCRSSAPDSYSSAGSDIRYDNFGFGAEHLTDEFPAAMWVSANKPMVPNTYKTPLEVTLDTDEAVETAKFFRGIYNARGKFPLGNNTAKDAFEEGRIAFYCNDLGYLRTLRDGSDKGEEFGILPMPKLNEEQEEYRCLLNTDAYVISIPKTLEVADDETKKFVSTVISATCAAGGETAKTAYYNTLLGMYLNTNGEAALSKTIIDSAVFDFTVTYGSDIYDISRGTISPITNHIVDGLSIASYINSGKKYFKEYCDTNFQ